MNMKHIYGITLSAFVAAMTWGCSSSIKDIDISAAEPACVRQCSMAYSSCSSGGSQVGFKTETLRACKESYEVCVATCPRK
jgi:hypothetical protein